MKQSEKVEDQSNEVSELKNLEKTSENSGSPISNEENSNKNNSPDKDFSLLSPKSKIKKKKEIISKLRVLVDGNEDKDTFNKVKSLQDLWKQIGQLQDSKDRSLWSTYNALLDRFYDNRSIYFELKELDRKKNLEKKLIICDKAESLVTEKNIMKSVSQLNNLHSEFKHIGPVSKDNQNDIWERLKAASDLIYERKKEFILSIKDSLQENLDRKKGLIRKLDSFKDFNFSTIKDWSQKTKEIISLKDEWDSIGGVPNSDSKSINKDFWNIFKTFFQKKNKFFKKIDDSYKKNLQLKKDLIKKVETVMDSEEWDKTSTLIQSFQKEWKKIGKVPIRFKDSIYNEFKKSCDHFYNRRRLGDKDTIKLYQDNLILKTTICDEIIKLSKNDSIDQDEFFKLQVKYLEVGHIPKENIDDLKQKFKIAIDSVVSASEKKLTKDEFDKFKFIIELNSLAKNPYSKNKIIKKKSDLIKKIHMIESEIKNLKNNIYYLKESVAADNLKKEYMSKIDQSDKEIESLKLQLNLINKV